MLELLIKISGSSVSSGVGSSSSGNYGKNKFDGTVDIATIKEIRPGKSSKDFMKWSEESNNVKAVRCFVVFYGTEFNLKTLSVVALSGDERDNWIKGLNYLMASVKGSTYRTAQERMFRKSFYSLEQPGREGRITPYRR